MTSISCSDIYGLYLKGKVSMFLEFWQRRSRWELIRLWLSSGVERCVLQGEPDPLLPESVNRKCWGRGINRCKKLYLTKKTWWYFALLCTVRTSLGNDTSGWTTELRPADSTAIFIPGKVPFTLNDGIAFSFRFTLCKNISSENYSHTVSIVARLHPAARSYWRFIS